MKQLVSIGLVRFKVVEWMDWTCMLPPRDMRMSKIRWYGMALVYVWTIDRVNWIVIELFSFSRVAPMANEWWFQRKKNNKKKTKINPTCTYNNSHATGNHMKWLSITNTIYRLPFSRHYYCPFGFPFRFSLSALIAIQLYVYPFFICSFYRS